MNLSDKIYSCRKKTGLSQEALAEKLGVSRQAVSKWETAEAIPELSKIPVMAKIFGVTADWLLSDKDDFIPHTHEEDQHGQYHTEPPKSPSAPSSASGSSGAGGNAGGVFSLEGKRSVASMRTPSMSDS